MRFEAFTHESPDPWYFTGVVPALSECDCDDLNDFRWANPDIEGRKQPPSEGEGIPENERLRGALEAQQEENEELAEWLEEEGESSGFVGRLFER